jgi:glucose dehydrogenase
MSAGDEADHWLAHGRDPQKNRFSPLDQVDSSTFRLAHSERRASMGSSDAARRAGEMPATSPTPQLSARDINI